MTPDLWRQLLAIPAVYASGLLELREIDDGPVAWGPTILATAVGFVVALAVIHWFLEFVSTRGFGIFVWYRVGRAAVIYVLLLSGTVQA